MHTLESKRLEQKQSSLETIPIDSPTLYPLKVFHDFLAPPEALVFNGGMRSQEVKLVCRYIYNSCHQDNQDHLHRVIKFAPYITEICNTFASITMHAILCNTAQYHTTQGDLTNAIFLVWFQYKMFPFLFLESPGLIFIDSPGCP